MHFIECILIKISLNFEELFVSCIMPIEALLRSGARSSADMMLMLLALVILLPASEELMLIKPIIGYSHSINNDHILGFRFFDSLWQPTTVSYVIYVKPGDSDFVVIYPKVFCLQEPHWGDFYVVIGFFQDKGHLIMKDLGFLLQR